MISTGVPIGPPFLSDAGLPDADAVGVAGGAWGGRRPKGGALWETLPGSTGHIYLSLPIITYLPIYLSIHLSIYLPTYLHTYIPTYLPTYLPIYLSTYLPIYRSIDLSIYRSIYLSVYLSIYPSKISVATWRGFDHPDQVTAADRVFSDQFIFQQLSLPCVFFLTPLPYRCRLVLSCVCQSFLTARNKQRCVHFPGPLLRWRLRSCKLSYLSFLMVILHAGHVAICRGQKLWDK